MTVWPLRSILGLLVGLVHVAHGLGPPLMTSAEYYVDSLPGLDPASSLVLYAGHVPVELSFVSQQRQRQRRRQQQRDREREWRKREPAPPQSTTGSSDSTNAHLFFILAKAKRTVDKRRLIIWLNGGPGCSSMDGAFMEIGAFRLKKSDDKKESGKGQVTLVEQNDGWNEYADVLFVDQPVGTGFSYANTNSYLRELSEASSEFASFMTNFYKIFPDLAKAETYLAGESYAGQYIPYFAARLLESTSLPIASQLKGIAIGNGWMDPINQYPAYAEFAFNRSVADRASPAGKAVLDALTKCEAKLKEGGAHVNVGECERVLGSIVDATIFDINGEKFCRNQYDIRLTDTYPACGMNWPVELKELEPYLRRKDVISALHAESKDVGWTECSGAVSRSFGAKNSVPSVSLLPDLLQKIDVLLFSGDADLICTHVGTERMIDDLTWSGHQGWTDANTTQARDWILDGQHVGTVRERDRLTYVKIFNSSHMVPYDLPRTAHDMILRFMKVDLTSAYKYSATNGTSWVGDDLRNSASINGSNADPGSSDTGKSITKSASTATSAISDWNTSGNILIFLVLIAMIIVSVLLCVFLRRRPSNLGRSLMSSLDHDANHRKGKKRVRSLSGHQVEDAAHDDVEDGHELDALVAEEKGLVARRQASLDDGTPDASHPVDPFGDSDSETELNGGRLT